jgi:hypothetical protein
LLFYFLNSTKRVKFARNLWFVVISTFTMSIPVYFFKFVKPTLINGNTKFGT